MTASDDTNQPSLPMTEARKPWVAPEIRDQSVKSLTEAKLTLNPEESSPNTGPS
jgi:hypothetical protein